MLTQAVLDVRVLPWRLRPRTLNPDTLRDVDPLTGIDDLGGLVLGLVFTVVIFVAAPVIVVALAIVLLPLEALLLAILGGLYLIARFAGLMRWTVLVVDAGGHESTEQYRFLPTALARVREINHDRRVKVAWHWA